ncbi:hypothetical protein CRYUN_Cryun09bG0185900 [Craigia yunnanensis]
MSSATICNYLTSCQVWDVDLQYSEDNFWPFQMLEINVKATFTIVCENPEEEEEEVKARGKHIVQEELHWLPLDQLLNDAVAKDWSDTNIWDVFESMQIPIQRSTIDEIVGCALGMAAMESYKNRKVLRMRVEVEALVNEQTNLEEGDAYCIDVESDDFWETVGAFRKLRKVMVEEPESAENVCSICLVEFLVGSEISATPCSHVFHDRCIRAWLKKCEGMILLEIEERVKVINNPRQGNWQCPKQGWDKINCDGAYCSKENRARIVVIRNSEGVMIGGMGKKIGMRSSIESEAMAVKKGIMLASRRQLRRTVVETDSEILHGELMLGKKTRYMKIAPIVRDFSKIDSA